MFANMRRGGGGDGDLLGCLLLTIVCGELVMRVEDLKSSWRQIKMAIIVEF